VTHRIAGAASSALVLALVLTACGGDDDRRAATTTTTTVPVSTSTPTTDPGATDAGILVGVAEGSIDGATRLPDDRWLRGVRSGCDELPELPDGEIAAFFELFRIQIEDDGATREQSRSAVLALVGGFAVACPELAERLEPLLPAT
jgi:hypothetical protein